MKLKDILMNLDKSEANRCDNITYDMEHFVAELELECYEVQQDPLSAELKSYWLCNHLCTDTFVGLRAYFLGDVFVCITDQSSRKSDEKFEWVSADAQEVVRNYILSLCEDNFEADTENLLDSEGYNFHTITIKDKLGKEFDIDIREVLVPWYTK